ncbi:MAG: helix-turn-helix domain-containing protein [Alphaproteobacteria bacterium]|nr:helix-turn-helix domain-containing protein [Alphaproteobacteria bacterium]MDE2336603.1 helix-turn-helix domain-containing protein [Alphaproteobacteria bacterium]
MAVPRAKTDEAGPNPVDIYVGSKVKSRRLILGLSQEELAKAIGLTFQQVQKYERGTNRISVSRLVDICKVLKVQIDYFFDGSFSLSGKSGTRNLALKGFSDTKQEALEPDPLIKRDVMELVRAYSGIKNPQLKRQILEMAKAMSTSGADGKTL